MCTVTSATVAHSHSYYAATRVSPPPTKRTAFAYRLCLGQFNVRSRSRRFVSRACARPVNNPIKYRLRCGGKRSGGHPRGHLILISLAFAHTIPLCAYLHNPLAHTIHHKTPGASASSGGSACERARVRIVKPCRTCEHKTRALTRIDVDDNGGILPHWLFCVCVSVCVC